MEFHDGSVKTAILYASLLTASVWLFRAVRRSWRLPPGPRGLPFWGNILQVPSGKQWIAYTEWARQYGPIFSLRFYSERVFILNTQAIASDILDKRSNTSAARPENMVVAADLIGWNRAISLSQNYTSHRRLMARALNPTAVRQYRSLQEQSAEALVRDMMTTPADFYDHIRNGIGRQIVNISYGRNMTIRGRDFITYAEEVHDVFFLTARPYSYVVDFVPILKHVPSWVPGFSFIRKAGEWRKDLDELVEAPFQMVRAELARDDAPPSYVTDSLQKSEIKALTQEEEDSIKWSASSLYTGGADSTIASLTGFVLLMCHFPAAQRRAQQEIDEVTGGDRLPTFEDAPRLKYVWACVQEALRYRPVLPLGIPHRVTSHEVYDGYDIPKDSTVIANMWAILHDENLYSDPFDFKPERFLSREDGGLEEPDSTAIVFGYGRRICPGMHLAEGSLLIYTARILAVLDISPAKDDKGEDILPPVDVDLRGSALVSMPKRFECNIKPRSPLARSLVAS
ncbi:cytochrome P450 [Vararia minispora EC-137]|uniref:Cytochrome P450 n=1 Tax=Vararia minispora EC-137 TaxID=1314806 RepID=A0ACB8QV08_9AGAM|nr:cytochrome P450 [Vararia minispora EC-137]